MAITSDSKFTISFQAYDLRTIGLASRRTALVDQQYALSYADGTGAGQFTRAYAVARTLSGSVEDVDLSGVLNDCFGGTINSSRIVAWGVRNTHATVDLVVGSTGGSNWTACLNGAVTLPAGAVMGFATPTAAAWPVSVGTTDLLHVASAGTISNTYDLIFWASE